MSEQPRPSRDVVNKVFGETLPEMPTGERDPDRAGDDDDRDRWLRDNIPPHHSDHG